MTAARAPAAAPPRRHGSSAARAAAEPWLADPQRKMAASDPAELRRVTRPSRDRFGSGGLGAAQAASA